MKKPTSSKRAALPRAYEYAAPFKKDWIRLERTGRYDMPQLKEVMMLLIANDGPLGPHWKDHPLTGDWKDCRDCHIPGDFLLIYRLEGETIVFVRAGTHADLFE